MTNPIIAFQNVSKVFEDSGTQVLKDINFELEEGKFYTLLGASGSGKSTILNIIAGLLDATSGDVLLDGKRINDIPINKRDVHTVFQSYALFPHMNVFDNVAFALKLKKVPKKEIEERVKEALKMVQLDGYQKRSIQKLSGGQRQRVAAAGRAALRPGSQAAQGYAAGADEYSKNVGDHLYLRHPRPGRSLGHVRLDFCYERW